jgi:hypothetical protein
MASYGVNIKSKFHFKQVTKTQTGCKAYLYSSLDIGARCGWVVNATPRPLYPPERPAIHYIGGWMCLRAGLDVRKKSLPPPEFDPWTVQPVASSYTD